MQTQLSLILSNQDKTSSSPLENPAQTHAPSGGRSDISAATHPFRMELKAMQDGAGLAQQASAAPSLVAPVTPSKTSEKLAPPTPPYLTKAAEALDGEGAAPSPIQTISHFFEELNRNSGGSKTDETVPLSGSDARPNSGTTSGPTSGPTSEPTSDAILSQSLALPPKPSPAGAPDKPSPADAPLAASIAPPPKPAYLRDGKSLPEGKDTPPPTGQNLPLSPNGKEKEALANSPKIPGSPLASKGNAQKAVGRRNTSSRALETAAKNNAAANPSAGTSAGTSSGIGAGTTANLSAAGQSISGPTSTGAAPVANPNSSPNTAIPSPATKPLAQVGLSSHGKTPQVAQQLAGFYPDASPKQAPMSGQRVALDHGKQPVTPIADTAGRLSSDKPASPKPANDAPVKSLVTPMSERGLVAGQILTAETPQKGATAQASRPINAARQFQKPQAINTAKPAKMAAKTSSSPAPELVKNPGLNLAPITPKVSAPIAPNIAGSTLPQNPAPIAPFSPTIAAADIAPASAGSTSTAENMPMRDLEGLVEKLSAARVLSRADKSSLSINHPDFGKVTMEFSAGGNSRLGLDMPDAPAELRQAVAQNFAQNNPANTSANTGPRGEAMRGETGQPRSEMGDNQTAGSDSGRGNANSNASQNAREQTQNSGQQGRPGKTTQDRSVSSLTTADESAPHTAQGTWA